MCDLKEQTPQQVFIVDTAGAKKAFIDLMPDWILEDFEEFFHRTLNEMIAASLAESLIELEVGTLPRVIDYKGKEYYAEFAANFHLDDRADEYPTKVYEIIHPALEKVTDIDSSFYSRILEGQADKLMAVNSPGLQPLWYGVPRNNSTMFLEFHGDIRAYYWDMFGKLPKE